MHNPYNHFYTNTKVSRTDRYTDGRGIEMPYVLCIYE